MNFRNQTSKEERKTRSKNLKSTHPDRVPVVITYDETELSLKKDRYLIPLSFTTATVRTIIRKNLDTSDLKRCLVVQDALFYFLENPDGGQSILAPNELMSLVAKTFTHDDAFAKRPRLDEGTSVHSTQFARWMGR
jgi:hypothetical protein